MESFAKQADGAAKMLGAAFSFSFLKDAGAQLASFIKSGADAADNMGDLAAAVGMPVEAMSKLAYAAEASDVSAEQLGQSLGKLSKLMADSQSGGTQQAAVFSALGISVTDANGALRSSGDVFADVAERFAGLQDGAGKAALAQKLFGESGAKLIPLLNEGKEGLRKFGEEAERLGLVVTAEGAAGAERFNKALKALDGVGQGLAMRVAQDLAPSLATLANELVNGENSAATFSTASAGIAAVIRSVASAAAIGATGLEFWGKTVAAAAYAVSTLDFSKAKEAFRELKADVAQSGADLEKRLKAIWTTSSPATALENGTEKTKKAADDTVKEINKITAAHERAKKAAEESAKAFREGVKSTLALGRQHEGIDRDVSKRRAAASGSSPTTGYANLDAAFAAYDKALHKEINLRAEATAAGRKGEDTKEHQLLRAADAQRELAESASAAASAFESLVEKKKAEDASWVANLSKGIAEHVGNMQPVPTVGDVAAEAGAGLANSALGASPILGDVVDGASMGAAAGPVGAAIGGAAALLANSKGFGEAMDTVSGILQSAADTLGTLFESLQPLLKVVGVLVENALRPLKPVLDVLGEVLTGVAFVVGGIVNAIADVWNAIIDAVAGVVDIFDTRKGDFLRRMKMEEVDFDTLLAVDEKADEAGKGIDELGKAARDAASSMTNVPGWWRVDTARFGAALPGSAHVGGGGGGTTVQGGIHVETHVHAAPGMDTEALADAVTRQQEARLNNRLGTRFGRDYDAL
jgi:hypothetical protein